MESTSVNTMHSWYTLFHHCDHSRAPWQQIHVAYTKPFMVHVYLIVVNAHPGLPEVLYKYYAFFFFFFFFSAQTVEMFSLVFKDRRVGKKWAMEKIPYNLHMKPINHLVNSKNVKCPLHSFLIFEKGLVERFTQTFKGVAHTMIPAKDNLQHQIANFLLFCTKAVHTAIIVIPGLSYIIRRLNPEVPE